MAERQDVEENGIVVSRDEHDIVTVTLDRPDKKNAVSHAMWLRLAALFAGFDADDAARVVVLRGAGADFCAGADISEFDAVRRDAGTARNYEAANSAAFTAIRRARCPVIAQISGICFGGGFGIAASCDLRLASADAAFCVPPAKLGLAYPADAMADIVAAAGPQMARYLAYSAARLTAAEARAAGLLLEVLPDAASLDARTKQIARTIAANAPLSIRASKASIRAALTGDAADLASARALGDATFDSADYAEGRAAFRERRPPRFAGN